MNHVPTSPKERIVTLDVIRAVALFGILLVNMKFFSTPVLQAEIGNYVLWDSYKDQISQWLIFIFAEFKFISMFSLLFGLGFLLFMERGERRGVDVKRLYRRRLLVLLCFGLIHIFLFWYGDILTFYAMFGFFLFFLRQKKPAFLVKLAVILVVVPTFLFLLLAGLLSMVNVEETETFVADAEIERIIAVYSEGTYVEMFLQRLNDIGMMLVGNLFLGMIVFAMFCIGMAFWKLGIFTNTADKVSLIRKFRMIALIIALPSLSLSIISKTLYNGGDSPWYFLQYGGLLVSGPSMAVIYVLSILLLLQNKQRLVAASRFLQPVGRMALSNYLMQTLICTFIFYSYGLGLFGKIGSFYGIVLTIVIYVVQIVVSSLWLKRFQYGPMEYVWRRLTYGKVALKERLEKAQ